MNIIELAKEAGLSIRGHYDESGSTPQELERFAALVRAERDWVDLTDDEIELLGNHELKYISESYEITGVFDFARAVIAKFKEKNK